jgi:hypothetical protein
MKYGDFIYVIYENILTDISFHLAKKINESIFLFSFSEK